MSSTSMASSSERLGPLLVATDSMARLISVASVTTLTISRFGKRGARYSSGSGLQGLAIATMS